MFAGLRSAQFGQFHAFFRIGAPPASASSGLIIQDGAQPARMYLDAGEDVWLSATKSGGTSAQISVALSGHYVAD